MFQIVLLLITSSLVQGSYSKPAEPEERIIGGEKTTIQKYPYLLTVEINGKSNCSGTIIAEKWALTAASCLNGGEITADKIKFRSGSTNKNNGGKIHHASKIIIHPNYNSTLTSFNYALVQVKESFPIGSSGVDKIPLAWDDPPTRVLATVSGWGVINNKTTQQPNTLYDVQVPILDRGICKGVYYGMILITEQIICAGFSEGGKDPCRGDSGGPLVYDGAQVGIVSQTFCGQPNRPAVYSGIPNQRTWIKSTIGV